MYIRASLAQVSKKFTSNLRFVLLDFTLSLKSSIAEARPPDFARTWGVKLSNLGLNLTSLFAYISSFLGKNVT